MPVVVRFIALGRDRVEVVPGGRFAIGVSTDVPRYRWRFGGRTAVGSGPLLRLTAPEEPGTYTLFVRTPDGHADSATVVVQDGRVSAPAARPRGAPLGHHACCA